MKNFRFSFIITFCIAIFFAACGSTNQTPEDALAYRSMVERINNLDFEIENDWANPARYQRMNLIGNPNHIRVKGDSVNIFLPFFGVRHSGGYRGDGAVIYEGIMENLKIEENERKGEIRMSFEGSHKSENMDFDITIFPNGRTTTYFSSSQRDRITYDGELKE